MKALDYLNTSYGHFRRYYRRGGGFLVAFLLFFGGLAGYCQVPTNQCVFIDSRLMLVAHPMFQKFNPQDRRFGGTSSDPTLMREIGQNGMETRITELEAEIANLVKTWGKKISQAPKKKKKNLEKEFLAEKKSLEEKVLLLRGQKYSVKYLPGKPLFSEAKSIQGTVIDMARDFERAILTLKDKWETPIVLDIASLMPDSMYPVDSRELLGWNPTLLNAKTPFKKDLPAMLNFLKEAKAYWLNNDQELIPLVFGARDGRLRAVQIMTENLESKK